MPAAQKDTRWASTRGRGGLTRCRAETVEAEPGGGPDINAEPDRRSKALRGGSGRQAYDRCPLTAYDSAEWSDLFIASAGAGGALAGLVFVAVSINVERILRFEGLPERALESVLLLLSVVIVSIIALIPGQSHIALGAELLAAGLVFGAAIGALSTRSMAPGTEPGLWLASRLVIRASGTLPLVVGGVSVLFETGGGLYWTVAGIVFATAGAVASAWVLLVEILR
jgi:hypothetical protein